MVASRSIVNDLSAYGIARSTIQGTPLNEEELRKTHAFWSAWHWGASPALSFIYTHLTRVVKSFDADMIFMAGPGYGAPGVLAPSTGLR